MGNVKIWDAINDEHILKSEFKILSGPIKDICWDHESKRILVVGDGKDKFGHVFTFDSGNSVGTIDAHGLAITGCSLRPKRPFRAITCSHDKTMVFFHGVPYKFNKTLRDHTSFVNDVKYSNSGDYFVSVGSDKKIFLFDGLSGDLISEIGDQKTGHSGSVFGVSWSPDDQYILTSSADKTCKIWKVETKELIKTISVGDPSDTMNMQMGNLWTSDFIVSISLSGNINLLSMDSDVPFQIITGHQKPITSGSIANEKILYTGSYDGRIYILHYTLYFTFNYNPAFLFYDSQHSYYYYLLDALLEILNMLVLRNRSTDAIYDSPTLVDMPNQSSQVNSITVVSDDVLAIGTMNDKVSLFSTKSNTTNKEVKFNGAPKSVLSAVDGKQLIVQLSNNSVVTVSAIENDTTEPKMLIKDDATSIALHPKQLELAVGYSNNSVVVYALQKSSTGALLLGNEKYTISYNRREVTILEYSHNGKYLASGDGAGKIYVVEAESGNLVTNKWVFHTAAVLSMSWFSDNKHLVSGSLDSNVYVWDIDNPNSHIAGLRAHPTGVSKVFALGTDAFISCGSDAIIKKWKVVN
ncbi:hypothetical protein BB560_006529 [Smittium megazygosporum]|uniref:Uncharacterized protein n=1 Tax=Smittium megazygosporum TaxID=133381 RepID=A0A2T9Y4F6_9FUNG|nr:hypothetical protein BB560_006529 [Smittium megazygosporum]